MDEALRHYYLQQMGIESWQLRTKRTGIKLMVIGEPMLNQSTLLKAMLKSIGLFDEDVSIAEVGTREGNHKDISDLLTKKIAQVMPQVILLAGECASFALFDKDLCNSGVDRGIHDYQGMPVIASYHPTHLMQNRLDKKKAYTDLLSVQQLLAR